MAREIKRALLLCSALLLCAAAQNAQAAVALDGAKGAVKTNNGEPLEGIMVQVVSK